MKVWVIRNKRKEFRYFPYIPYYEPKFAGPNETRGHYVRTDTWPEDIDYGLQTHEFVPDEPPIPQGTWYVRQPNGEVDYGKRLDIRYVPPIRRKVMTHCSEPIVLEINDIHL
jgi:hypothetical protein